MIPWLESLADILFALSGAGLGYWFSRLKKPYWTLGYFIPFSLILVYGFAIHRPATWLVPPISWLMLGRRKFAIIGFMATMVLTTPLSRLPRKRDRALICVLMATIVFGMSVWPFLAPAFNRNYLARLETKIDPNGICRQSNDYTCGPAAAVTALRKLGVPAEEGQIAIWSHTTAAAGTPPDILAQVLQERYGKEGLIAEFRTFKDIAELKKAGPTLAVIKFTFMVDHYVAVIVVTDSEVVVGDPLAGLDKISYDEFRRKWRFEGVVLRRAQ
jgi:predicted double-glycine peptidase